MSGKRRNILFLIFITAVVSIFISRFNPSAWMSKKSTPPPPADTSTAGIPKQEKVHPSITEPLIPLDEPIREQLKKFREKATSLAVKYPETFFIKGSGDKRRIALTFDEGPDTVYLPQILDLLGEYKIKATFFLLGQNVEKNPEIAVRILKEGHEIASHSWSHPRLYETGLKEVKDQVEKTEKVMTEVLDIKPTLIRPPYGLIREDHILYFKDKGYRLIDWSIDSMDWYTQEEELISQTVSQSIHPSAIILMHSSGGKDGKPGTLRAIRQLIPYLQKQGYSFVTVSELLKE